MMDMSPYLAVNRQCGGGIQEKKKKRPADFVFGGPGGRATELAAATRCPSPAGRVARCPSPAGRLAQRRSVLYVGCERLDLSYGGAAP